MERSDTLSALRATLLGSFDLVDRTELTWRGYANPGLATSVLIHERAHTHITRTTTFGFLQSSLARIARSGAATGDAQGEALSKSILERTLQMSRLAHEGFAVEREKLFYEELGIGQFSRVDLPPDYEGALQPYERIMRTIPSGGPLARLILLHAIAEVAFNIDILPQLLTLPFDDWLGLISGLGEELQPDLRIATIAELCEKHQVLGTALTHLQGSINLETIVTQHGAMPADVVLGAAFETPNTYTEHQLHMAYLAAAVAVDRALEDCIGDLPSLTQGDVIQHCQHFRDQLPVHFQAQGIEILPVRYVGETGDWIAGERVHYTLRSSFFEMAPARPEEINLLTKILDRHQGAYGYYVRLGHVDRSADTPDTLDASIVFTMFQKAADRKVSIWNIQLVVPMTAGDIFGEAIARRVIDEILLADQVDLETFTDKGVAIGPLDDIDNKVILVQGTDGVELQELLGSWSNRYLPESVTRLHRAGMVTYYRIKFPGVPRVIARVPMPLLVVMQSADYSAGGWFREASTGDPTVDLDYYDIILCLLTELGAFASRPVKVHDTWIFNLFESGYDGRYLTVPVDPIAG